MKYSALLLLLMLFISCSERSNQNSAVNGEGNCLGLQEVKMHYDGGSLKEYYFVNCENNKDSLYTSYFRSGRVLLQGYYQNGRKQGEWRDNDIHKNPSFPELPNTFALKQYRNDTLLEEYVHEAPQYDTTCTQAESFIRYVSPNEVHKHVKGYDYCNGVMNYESFWVNDRPDSIHRTWNEQGHLYKLYYHENLLTIKEVEYDSWDTTQLVKISYFENDQLTKTEHYKNNKVVRTEYPEE